LTVPSPTPPLVSVIVPVFQGARFLAGAIENIFRDAYRPLDVIVVDDGSSDGADEVARRFEDRVRYIRQENAGAAAARNTGIRAAAGELVAFLDVDDLWPPGKLARQVSALARGEADLSIGLTKWIEIEQTIGIDERTAIDALPGPVAITPCLGSALVRRAVFDRIGLFDPGLRASEDLDWFVRAKEARVPTVVLREVTLLYRRHGASLTHGKDLVEINMLKVLKRSLDRRRAEAGAPDARSLERPR
jgi:glycosyltransferase involved in cell wall biosynthesis